jgi:hypothetical protein
MNSLAYSRVSVDVFRPSRNYIDVIKGIPIIIEKRNGFRDDLTQRSDSIRPVFNKLESIVKNPLLRMSIEGARINLAVVQNDKFELIPPEKPSKIIVYFENLMNLLVPYSIAESLNELSFEGSYYGQNIVSEVVWALFVIDFISNFFWIKRISGQNLHSKKAITKHYLKTWALFDLISLIPLRWSGNLNAEACLKLIRVLKLGRVRRMLKIDNLSRYLIQKLTKSHKRHIRTEFCIASIWELVLKISVMAHISYSFGCIWWYWSDLMYRYNYTSQNFINYYGLNEKSKNEQGVITTYYIVTSVLTIGYGDYSSTNIYEMGITIFCLMLSVLVFSSLMNTATTLISILSDSLKNKKNSRKNEKILNILKASHEEFPLKLKDSISNFFVYYSKTDRLGSLAKSYKNQRDAKKIMKRQDNIFKPLPVRLKRKILDTLFNDYFAYFRRIFSDKSDFKYHICSFLIPRRFFDGEIIIHEGIKCKELYLIMKGVVSLNFNNYFV